MVERPHFVFCGLWRLSKLTVGTSYCNVRFLTLPGWCEATARSGTLCTSNLRTASAWWRSGLMRSHEVRRREAVATEEGGQLVTVCKPRAVLCLRRSTRYPSSSRQRTASSWRGLFREGRSGEVTAGTERTHYPRSGKPVSVLWLWRSMRYYFTRQRPMDQDLMKKHILPNLHWLYVWIYNAAGAFYPFALPCLPQVSRCLLAVHDRGFPWCHWVNAATNQLQFTN